MLTFSPLLTTINRLPQWVHAQALKLLVDANYMHLWDFLANKTDLFYLTQCVECYYVVYLYHSAGPIQPAQVQHRLARAGHYLGLCRAYNARNLLLHVVYATQSNNFTCFCLVARYGALFTRQKTHIWVSIQQQLWDGCWMKLGKSVCRWCKQIIMPGLCRMYMKTYLQADPRSYGVHLYWSCIAKHSPIWTNIENNP